MNIEDFTTKAQKIISKSQIIASENGHQAIEPGHLLLALLSEAKSSNPQILKFGNVKL